MSKTYMDYAPRPVDVNWAKAVIAALKDGGTLAYPDTQLIYVIDKQAKHLTLQNPEQLNDLDNRITHGRTVITFRALGYDVREKG